MIEDELKRIEDWAERPGLVMVGQMVSEYRELKQQNRHLAENNDTLRAENRRLDRERCAYYGPSPPPDHPLESDPLKFTPERDGCVTTWWPKELTEAHNRLVDTVRRLEREQGRLAQRVFSAAS